MRLERISYTLLQVEDILNLSHQAIYNEINAGRLRTFKIGRRRFVSGDALIQFVKDREKEAA